MQLISLSLSFSLTLSFLSFLLQYEINIKTRIHLYPPIKRLKKKILFYTLISILPLEIRIIGMVFMKMRLEQ